MTTIETTSRVGLDGVLTLSLPMGPDAAGREVAVKVMPAPKRLTVEEWQAHVEAAIAIWLKSPVGLIPKFKIPEYFNEAERQAMREGLVGSWQSDFERPPQGDYPVRESFE